MRNKKFDGKAVAHLKESKFNRSTGGVGWANFYEDMMVAIVAVDKDSENAVKLATDLKKEMDEPDSVILAVEHEDWENCSGELFARLMEITRGEAQKLVRNEGQKSDRCGFWTLRKMMERFSPKTVLRLLKTLVKAIQPAKAKSVQEEQAAIEGWEADQDGNRVRRNDQPEYQGGDSFGNAPSGFAGKGI